MSDPQAPDGGGMGVLRGWTRMTESIFDKPSVTIGSLEELDKVVRDAACVRVVVPGPLQSDEASRLDNAILAASK